jgi:hypothetical protein
MAFQFFDFPGMIITSLPNMVWWTPVEPMPQCRSDTLWRFTELEAMADDEYDDWPFLNLVIFYLQAI